MMKKLLLLGAALFAFNYSVVAQCVPTNTTVTDTLHYYFNKYYFKTGQLDKEKYPFYKSAASTVTNVTHCGSRFETCDTIWVTGVEAFCAKDVVTANLAIPMNMYLCDVDPSNGLPIWPPIDSLETVVGGTATAIYGGNFTKPRKVARDYAVLFRNMSQVSGDTIHLVRTNGATMNNMAASPAQRSSDGNYGYVRYLGKFYSTQNFTLSKGFGVGTDYEFMVAPRVQYTVQASHAISQNILDANAGLTDTLCTRTKFTFTNTSSCQYTNRFFNLIEFYRKWNLYSAFVAQPIPVGFPADSSIAWTFEYEENALPPRDPRTFLPYVYPGQSHRKSITSATDMPGCFDANQFRARLKKMREYGNGSLLAYNCNFNICMKYCNDDAVGISGVDPLLNLAVYPNPLVNGKTSISGLKGKNNIKVFDLLGQQILSFENESSIADIDLQKHAKGTYVIRVTNSENETKVIKVIKQD